MPTSSERCAVCRNPPAENDDLCERCRDWIRTTLAGLPPIPPDVLRKIARILTS